MRHFILLITVAALFSCSQNDTKQKELELRERELALKEKELQLKENPNSKDTAKTISTTIPETPTATLNVTYRTQAVSPNVDMTYYKGKDVIFYYDEKTKGKIVIDNIEYPLTSEKRTDKGKFVNYTYTGNNVTIKAINGKFDEHPELGEDEELDVYEGKIQTLIITTDKGSLTLSNVKFSYSMMSGM